MAKSVIVCTTDVETNSILCLAPHHPVTASMLHQLSSGTQIPRPPASWVIQSMIATTPKIRVATLRYLTTLKSSSSRMMMDSLVNRTLDAQSWVMAIIIYVASLAMSCTAWKCELSWGAYLSLVGKKPKPMCHDCFNGMPSYACDHTCCGSTCVNARYSLDLRSGE